MRKVVVISGHPNLESSNTNTIILEELSSKLNDIQIRKLDALYPNYQIDIEEEQKALLAADIIVLQFPFYWYSVPALLKKWLDDVFSYNFAYGAKGDKLKGKDLILSFTIGGPEESYNPLGYNHFTIEQLIFPLQQTAYLAGMTFTSPIYSHRMVYIPDVYNELEDVQNRAKEHASKVVTQVNNLQYLPEKRISKFIAEWFAKFDALPEESNYFTHYLADNIKFVMPEGDFHGLSGFRDWYHSVRKIFKPNCQHIVEQINITEVYENNYEVELRIRLIAETYTDSHFNGEDINLLVNEKWQLSLSNKDDVKISHYLVDVINNK